MATGSNKMDNSSDTLFDFFCELCQDDGTQLEAEGYCVDCGEYLCQTCFNHHRRSRPTRHHELLDKGNMPRDSPLPSEPVSKDIWSKCDKHRGRPIEYYCKNHNYLGCNVCFTMNHRGCQNVDFIPDVSEQILDSKEFLKLKSNLKDMTKKADTIALIAKANIEKAERYFNKALESMEMIREEINGILNELEQEMRSQLEKMKIEDIQKMDTLNTNSESLLKNVERIASEIQKLESSRKVCQLYIAKVKFEPEIRALMRETVETETQASVREYIFKPNKDISNILKGVDVLGNALVKNIDGINISESSDEFKSLVSGSVSLSKNKIAITDHFNHKVKLVDSSTKKVLHSVNLGVQPWDVSALGDNQIVVTTGINQQLIFLRLTPRSELQVQRKINVNGNCHGVTYRDKRLFVTFVKPAKLELMDINGKVLKTIRKDKNKRSYFKCPDYVCISKDGKYIYVSDYQESRGKLVRMTMDGVADCVYSDTALRGAQKVCLDDEGNVFVCGYHSKNVYALTADCKKKEIVINQENGLYDDVYSVSYCSENKCFYVGMRSGALKVYNSRIIGTKK